VKWDGEEDYCFLLLFVDWFVVRMKSMLTVDWDDAQVALTSICERAGVKRHVEHTFSAEHGDAVVRFESCRRFLVNKWHGDLNAPSII
jgi:hypothetical protein